MAVYAGQTNVHKEVKKLFIGFGGQWLEAKKVYLAYNDIWREVKVAIAFTPPHTNSLIFDGTSYLEANPISAPGGDRQKYIFSAWVYRSKLGSRQMILSARVVNEARFEFSTSDQLSLTINGSGANVSDAVFRDVGWYQVGFIVNTTEPLADNRIKIMVKGDRTPSTGYQPSLNDATSSFNGPSARTQIGSDAFSNPGLWYNGGMTDLHFLDGIEMTEQEYFDAFLQEFPVGIGANIMSAPTSATVASYGADGWNLKFENSLDFGEDSSGNGKDFSVFGFVPEDQITDVPGDPYPIMSPLNKQTVVSIQEGGTRTTYASGAVTGISMASIPFPNYGKWYYEHTATVIGGDHHVGIHNTRSISTLDGINIFAASASTFGEEVTYLPTGNKQLAGVQSVYGATFTAGDVIGVLYDGDANTLEFFKNGVSQGVISSGISGQYSVVTMTYSGGQADINFGQRVFEYTPPTGSLPLKSSNLATPLYHGGDKFHVNTRTGTGAEDTILTPFDKTGLYWAKDRSVGRSHQLYDRLRGATKYLDSGTGTAEGTSTEGLKSFNTGSLTIGDFSGVNNVGETFVDWIFGNDGTEITNNDGTIPSQVIVDSSGYFSLATATANGSAGSFGHGLDDVELSIVKSRNNVGTTGWNVWHKSLSSSIHYLSLDTSSAQGSGGSNFSGLWGGVIGLNAGMMTNGAELVSLNFASVPRLSKVFTYEGNSNSDGTFIYCGFTPRWVLIKGIDAANEWLIYDTERKELNPNTLNLRANSAAAEVSNTDIDILSNGFKLRTSSSNINLSSTYVGLAIADVSGGGELPWPLGR